MEFSNLIPLFFLETCCFVVTPIAGFSFAAALHFGYKDRQLARNSVLTAGLVALAALVWPLFELIWSSVLLALHCHAPCGDVALLISPANIMMTLRYGLILILPGLTVGFIIAYCIVLPLTFLVRHLRRTHVSSPTTHDRDGRAGRSNIQG